MKDKIKAIFIDAENKEISEVEIVPELASYYKLINCELVETCCMDLLSSNSFIYVDEEGLYNKDAKFYVKGAPQPYIGNGVMLCLSDEGEDQSVNMVVDEVKKYISF